MKTKFKLTTPHSFSNFKNGISKDKLRSAMSGCIIDFSTKKLYVTDSHIIVSYPIECEQSDFSISVPATLFDIKRYPIINFNIMKETNQDITFFEYEYDSGEGIINVHYDDSLIYSDKIISNTTPNCEAVMTNITEGSVKEVKLDICLLEKINKCVKLSGVNSLVTLLQKTHSSCIKVVFKHHELETVEAIMMPWTDI